MPFPAHCTLLTFDRVCSNFKILPPYTPLSYSKTGECRGIPIFLIFAPKHRLLVLVRTAPARRFLRVSTIYVLSKNRKNIKIFLQKIFNFYNLKLHGLVFVMYYTNVCAHKQFSPALRTTGNSRSWQITLTKTKLSIMLAENVFLLIILLFECVVVAQKCFAMFCDVVFFLSHLVSMLGL